LAPNLTFGDLVTSGTARASVERGDLEDLLQRLNERFGLEIAVSEEVFDTFQNGIPFVIGSYWQVVEAIERKEVLRRLEALSDAVRRIKHYLGPVRSGFHAEADLQTVLFLARTMDRSLTDPSPQPMDHLETILSVIELLDRFCDQALAALSQIPAKKGQRGLTWYRDYVALLRWVAEALAIKITTAGDRTGTFDEDAYLTPFTFLVYEAEKFLPEKARSRSLSACAKRIERALKQETAPPRQKER
jgi:hypothetical protein